MKNKIFENAVIIDVEYKECIDRKEKCQAPGCRFKSLAKYCEHLEIFSHCFCCEHLIHDNDASICKFEAAGKRTIIIKDRKIYELKGKQYKFVKGATINDYDKCVTAKKLGKINFLVI